jgi:isopropylmalate/homocitrate/citramalate synthase
MLTNPLMFDPFPPKIVGRTTSFYLGKQLSKELVAGRLKLAQISATPRQIDSIYTMMRRAGERLDKGAMQMTFYHMKKLQKEMHKGLTDDDFWLVVKRVTGKTPKFSENS